ncbi:MAG: hypothetical protein ACYC19_09635 [Acidimicrobiales bacterium]
MSRSWIVRRMVGALALAVVFVATPAMSTTAHAASVSANADTLRATFTYTGHFPQAKNARLVISESGTVRYDRPVYSQWCGHRCWPLQLTPHSTVLHVVHLQPKGPASVVLGLYSGGAHCCSVEQVFTLDEKTRTFHTSEYNFGDPGVRLLPIGPAGTSEFLSANDLFAYAFTDYAASGMPIQILSVSNGRFHDVTRSFPKLIARDASVWLRAFNDQARSHYQDTVGLAAAWAADEDMLGHFSAVNTFLAREAAAGHLNSALSPEEPSGQHFVVALQKFLRRHGYVH